MYQNRETLTIHVVSASTQSHVGSLDSDDALTQTVDKFPASRANLSWVTWLLLAACCCCTHWGFLTMRVSDVIVIEELHAVRRVCMPVGQRRKKREENDNSKKCGRSVCHLPCESTKATFSFNAACLSLPLRPPCWKSKKAFVLLPPRACFWSS